MKRRQLLLLLLAASLAGACTQEPEAPLLAGDVVVTPGRPGMPMRAAYLTLSNNSADTIVITHFSSPQFAAVELHETIIDNDIARMRPLDQLSIPPGHSARLERGGKHLMLMQPVAPRNASNATLQLLAWSDDTLLLTITAAADDDTAE